MLRLIHERNLLPLKERHDHSQPLRVVEMRQTPVERSKWNMSRLARYFKDEAVGESERGGRAKTSQRQRDGLGNLDRQVLVAEGSSEKLLRDPILRLRCSLYYSYRSAARRKLGPLATFFQSFLSKASITTASFAAGSP